jgi:cell division protein FtsB
MKLLKRIVLVIIISFLFFSLTKNVFDYRKTLDFYQSFKQDYERAKKQNVSLKTEILKNRDQREIEQTIRNKLNLLKPGEIAVIIPNPTPRPSLSKPPPEPVFMQWFRTFFWYN